MKKDYGRRTQLRLVEKGIRAVASTYGKRSLVTSSSKAGGLLAVESQAERIFASMLSIDPTVRRFKPQPFVVDIVYRRILRTPEDVAEARARHRFRTRDVFYTPDFEVHKVDGKLEVIEVKLESFEGDGYYRSKLAEVARTLREYGYRFSQVVLPGNRRHPIYMNAQLLRQASQRHGQRPSIELFDAIGPAHEAGAKTLRDFGVALGALANQMPFLIVGGGLAADLIARPIDWSLPAWPAHGDLDHLRLIGGFER